MPYALRLGCAVLALALPCCRSRPPTPEPALCDLPESAQLEVIYRRQLASQWCWAAATQMVLESLGRPLSQCAIAKTIVSECDCQDDASVVVPAACDRAAWPPFQQLGIAYDQTGPLSPRAIENELSPPRCRSRPFLFTWQWEPEAAQGGAHIMVADGFAKDGDQLWVWARDPAYAEIQGPPGAGVVSQGDESTLLRYDFFVGWPGHHTHTRDYSNLRAEN